MFSYVRPHRGNTRLIYLTCHSVKASVSKFTFKRLYYVHSNTNITGFINSTVHKYYYNMDLHFTEKNEHHSCSVRSLSYFSTLGITSTRFLNFVHCLFFLTEEKIRKMGNGSCYRLTVTNRVLSVILCLFTLTTTTYRELKIYFCVSSLIMHLFLLHVSAVVSDLCSKISDNVKHEFYGKEIEAFGRI